MKTIRGKISFTIIAISIATAFFVGLISFIFAKKQLENETREVHIKAVAYNSALFEKQIGQVKVLANVLEAELDNSFSNFASRGDISKEKELLLKQMEATAKTVRPFSLWVVFNTKHFPGKHVVSIRDVSGNGNYQAEPEYDVWEYVDTTGSNMDWWIKAIQQGEHWSNPYYWAPWDKTIISHSKAIFREGKLIAVVGSDFEFDELESYFTTQEIENDGYLWLTNKEGYTIIHPSHKGEYLTEHFHNQGLKELFNSTATNSKFFVYNFDGIKKVAAAQELSNGWTLAISTPYSKIFMGTYKLILLIGLTLIGSFLIAILIGIKVSQQLTRPIQSFVERFVKAAEGDLSVRVEEKSNDEIYLLEHNFNLFMSKTEAMVTELVEMHKSLSIEKKRAEESDKLKTAFLANMSHEIRTPLNAILGFTSLLKNNNHLTPETQDYTELIISNGYTLLNFIEKIIEISELESGVKKVSIERILVSDILSSIYKEYQLNVFKLHERNIAFELNIPERIKGLYLLSDKHCIQKIISHLLDNAVKFTTEGRIELGAAIDPKDNITFYVRDTGIGIKTEDSKTIFESFYKPTNNQSQYFSGAGLGLAIAKRIANRLDAMLWFESEYGKGTTFYLSTSKGIKGKDDDFAVDSSRKTDEQDYSWSKFTIVVAEDLYANFLLIKSLLAHTGINILWTKNGQETIDLARNKHIDLILMDLRMPQVDGLTATRQIREFKPLVPIIAQTAFATPEDKQQCIDAGCDDIVTKPIFKHELFMAMKRFLR
ncbi:MAG: response regulator [Bacteroidales bacterium]|nr:response regulator [Bacteroidales bacterium]MBN2749574.1 response regulator [Bacteroidales bacterium]